MVSQFAAMLSPGVYLRENTAGYRSSEIASHTTAYMVGAASTGPIADPTPILNVEDFKNQFGSSLSEASVRLYFRNDPTGNLYFIRAGIAKRFRVEIAAITAGNTELTINGVASSVVFVAGETMETARGKVITAVNQTAGNSATAIASQTEPDEVYIFADGPDLNLLTVTSNGPKLVATLDTPTSPTAADYVRTIETFSSYDDELPQGFILAPEAFQNIAQVADRLSVANAMQSLARSEGYDWVALIDCSPAADTITKLRDEGITITASLGHAAYFGPYGESLEGETVPVSAAVAGHASVKYKIQGYQEPIGGAVYPLAGLRALKQNYSRQEQDIVNPLGINLVRNLRNKGICLWGCRTRSSDALYRFVNTRVIMNTLNGTLRKAFDQFLFSSIGGTGTTLHRIEETAISVCRRMYRAGAFFGATDEDAYSVECSVDNNDPDDLENGNVLLAVYAAPVPGIEKLLILTHRVGIGQVQASKAAGRRVDSL